MRSIPFNPNQEITHIRDRLVGRTDRNQIMWELQLANRIINENLANPFFKQGFGWECAHRLLFTHNAMCGVVPIFFKEVYHFLLSIVRSVSTKFYEDDFSGLLNYYQPGMIGEGSDSSEVSGLINYFNFLKVMADQGDITSAVALNGLFMNNTSASQQFKARFLHLFDAHTISEALVEFNLEDRITIAKQVVNHYEVVERSRTYAMHGRNGYSNYLNLLRAHLERLEEQHAAEMVVSLNYMR